MSKLTLSALRNAVNTSIEKTSLQTDKSDLIKVRDLINVVQKEGVTSSTKAVLASFDCDQYSPAGFALQGLKSELGLMQTRSVNPNGFFGSSNIESNNNSESNITSGLRS